MLAQNNDQTAISIPSALKWVGIIAGAWALLVVGAATLAYVPDHPNFSPFTTFLSDIGDTAGGPGFSSIPAHSLPLPYAILSWSCWFCG